MEHRGASVPGSNALELEFVEIGQVFVRLCNPRFRKDDAVARILDGAGFLEQQVVSDRCDMPGLADEFADLGQPGDDAPLDRSHRRARPCGDGCIPHNDRAQIRANHPGGVGGKCQNGYKVDWFFTHANWFPCCRRGDFNSGSGSSQSLRHNPGAGERRGCCCLSVEALRRAFQAPVH